LSSTDLLAQYSSGWTDERKQKHFQRIQSAVKQLTNLVNDVLFVNQAEVGSLEFNPEPLDVEQVARRLVEEFQSNATYQHTIIFECQGSSTNALLDEKLIEAMLRNLLFNAIKYSPKGSLIQFELVFQQNTVVFRISDQGIGIPLADQGSLFTAFFRGSNVGTTPGVGLGLVIVRECVDLHAGEIVVESEVKVGTRFTVTLPLAQRLTSD
jgi:signal transduction histidine kinase